MAAFPDFLTQSRACRWLLDDEGSSYEQLVGSSQSEQRRGYFSFKYLSSCGLFDHEPGRHAALKKSASAATSISAGDVPSNEQLVRMRERSNCFRNLSVQR